MSDNPYWDEVERHAKPGEYSWERDTLQLGRLNFADGELKNPEIDRSALVSKYSWTVTDPDSVAFVAGYAEGSLVDPMAGTGYWAYVLEKLFEVDTVCYDLRPGDNPWHSEAAAFVEIEKLDGAAAVAKHPDRTLLLSWPPYSQDVGYRIVRAYAGRRLIYIGEYDGCTGDEALRDELETHWEEVAEHTPVQWFGLHDRITVYERKHDVLDDAEGAAAAVPESLRAGKKRPDGLSTRDHSARRLVPALQGDQA